MGIDMKNPWEQDEFVCDVCGYDDCQCPENRVIDVPVWTTEPPEEVAEEARIRDQVSRIRRDEYDAMVLKNTHRLWQTSVPFAFGCMLIIYELFKYTPTPALIILGIIMVIPFLTFALERIEER